MSPSGPFDQSWISIEPEVEAALSAARPVVALESTVISHGLPWPQNLELAKNLEEIVRAEGALPATIAVMEGRIRLGISADEQEHLARSGPEAVKCSTRDLGWVLARGLLGATTVAASIAVAEASGIRIMATGGIGGVHRGAQNSFDISADLPELARRSVAVVCAGPKAILDLALTREHLETLGVPIIGYRCDQMPAFYHVESDEEVDCRCDSVQELAAVVASHFSTGLGGGLLVVNPVPEAAALDRTQVDQAISSACKEAADSGITGKALTPFLLTRIEELTAGDSMETNLALLRNNARLAAQLALEI